MKHRWTSVLEIHSSAASMLVEAAASIPDELWFFCEGETWSPAHVVEHLCLAYEVLLRELTGGPGMGLRMHFWQRWALRLFLVPKLLRGEPFPEGARAPRETRPFRVDRTRQEAIEKFRALALSFDESVRKTYDINPKARLTHAYFGSSDLERAVLLCARHIQDHTRRLTARDRQIIN